MACDNSCRTRQALLASMACGLSFDSVRDAAGREITLYRRDVLAGEKCAQLRVAVALKEFAKTFSSVLRGLKTAEQTLDGRGNFSRRAAITDRTRDGGRLSEPAADAEVVRIHQFSVLFDFLAFDADVGNPVLAARVGATGYVKL